VIDIDAYKQLIGSLTKLVMDATEADARDMFEETVGNAVALYNQIKSDQTMLGNVADDLKNQVLMTLIVATGKQDWKGTTGSFYVSAPSVGMKLDEKRITNDMKTNLKLAEALETYWVPTSRAGALTIKGAK
jgi:hypothetical protein